MKTEFHRITRLPSYVFAEVNKLKAKYRDQGHDIIDFGMGMQEAVDSKKFHHQWLPDVLVVEEKTLSDELNKELTDIGHKIVNRSSLGRMDCILMNEDGSLDGGADKRGDNTAEYLYFFLA